MCTQIVADSAFADLLTIDLQRFKDTPILTMTALGPFGECLASARGRYARHFRVLQQMRIARGASLPVLLSVTVVSDARSDKNTGYVAYAQCSDRIGAETVFAFYHRVLRRVVLLISPAEEHAKAALRCICDLGVVLPFDRACGWCGAPAGGLKKCPCKGVRYCDAGCQRSHWATHRAACSRGCASGA
jgi:hypothetical protein